MDILLKDVKVNVEYTSFECPVCGADARVHEDDAEELYWMLRVTHDLEDDEIKRLPFGECIVCGNKKEV